MIVLLLSHTFTLPYENDAFLDNNFSSARPHMNFQEHHLCYHCQAVSIENIRLSLKLSCGEICNGANVKYVKVVST